MHLIKLIVYSAAFLAVVACEEAGKIDVSLWQPNAEQNSALIKVALRVNPASYYWQDGRATGFDYHLLQAFSDYTRTKLEIIPVATAAKAVDLLKKRAVDIAAGGLGATQLYENIFAVSNPYYQSKQYMIYRHPDVKPKQFEEIALSDIDISNNPHHIESLTTLYNTYNMSSTSANSEQDTKGNADESEMWYLHTDTPSYKLIEMINHGLIRYTVANAYELSATHFLYPYVKIAFTVAEEVPIVWLFNRSNTTTTSQHLVYLSNKLFATMQESGELERLTKSHPDHLELLSYAEKLTFIESAYRKLAKHKKYFKLAANKHHLDWKLLAALAYQESHWEAKAVSPTGVKGIMMLTQDIAQHYKVYDRSDAYQSIMGGTKYLSELLRRLPSEVATPDRVWMALVAYLAGYGHLEDAINLTRKRGANSHSWIELSHSLALLQQPEWYTQSKYGKPRDDVISYVNNIRNYQFLLSLLEDAISTHIPQSRTSEIIIPSRL